MDGLRRAQATNHAKLLRNTPTIFNVGLNAFLNWDAGTERLAPHDEKVLLSPALMATTWPEVLSRLALDADYRRRFDVLYRSGPTRAAVLDALAAYERSLITPNSRFDRYLRGERDALTAEELRGYQLFKSYGCVACHQGVNVGGNLVQKFGVFHETSPMRHEGEAVDLGRFKITGDPQDREVFRVPSLRNVAVTAPYFHDGRAATLELAVFTMAQVQLGRSISAEEITDIVKFLGSLTGEYLGQPIRSPERDTP